jgi:uncharacterized protein (DUF885 family)
LMSELGHYPDCAHHLGMLAQQQFRAARVVLDIGLHLCLEIPRGSGFGDGERWTPESGMKFLRERLGIADEHVIRREIDRYLGRPGQAASYKVGERIWLEVRAQARCRQGSAFDLKSFHRAALGLGPMGLDAFREAMADALSARVIPEEPVTGPAGDGAAAHAVMRRFARSLRAAMKECGDLRQAGPGPVHSRP